MLSIGRERSRNVKRWGDGEMVLRWGAAGMLHAERSFRGHCEVPKLRAALRRHVQRVDGEEVKLTEPYAQMLASDPTSETERQAATKKGNRQPGPALFDASVSDRKPELVLSGNGSSYDSKGSSVSPANRSRSVVVADAAQ